MRTHRPQSGTEPGTLHAEGFPSAGCLSRRSLLSGALLTVAGAHAAGAAAPDRPEIPKNGFRGPFHVVATAERRIEATLEYVGRVAPQPATAWYVACPAAPVTPFQTEVETRITVGGQDLPVDRVSERSALGRPLLTAMVDAQRGYERELPVRIVQRATMWSRQLVPGAPPTPVAPLPEFQRSRYLQPTPTCDYTAEPVRAWLRQQELTRRSGESVLEFAYRAFNAVRAYLAYELPGGGDFFKCSRSVRARTGDCGASNLLLSAALRTNGIPARVYCGYWALVRPTPQASPPSHSVGEFWADGVGWVPVDATAAPDRQPKDHPYKFGFSAGWYFADHEETDLVVPLPRWADQRLAWMHQYVVPYRPEGISTWAGHSTRQQWSVRHLEVMGTTWRAEQATRR